MEIEEQWQVSLLQIQVAHALSMTSLVNLYLGCARTFSLATKRSFAQDTSILRDQIAPSLCRLTTIEVELISSFFSTRYM